MDRWRGRVAVVTGASSGIGAAVCRMLSDEGMKVVGCARRVERIQELAKECGNVHPYKVRIWRKEPSCATRRRLRSAT
jgi:NADP-dependent 3-hydroxy acid dehydrogenase YdfG